MDNRIYETAVYCGRLKEWRILNLNTGTVYSTRFDEEQQALDAIEDRHIRDRKIVTRIRLRDLRAQLAKDTPCNS